MGKYDNEKMLLFQAATSEYGITIETVDLERDLGALYSAMREEKGSGLPEMELRRSPWNPKGEIWVIKKSIIKASADTAGASPGVEPPPPAITDITLGDLDL